MDVTDLVAIEEIRRVTHWYSWCCDSGDLDGLVAVFTEDAVCVFGPYGTWTGSEQIRQGFAESFRLPVCPARPCTLSPTTSLM
jgi:ketosteroid isomerase-like protein